MSGIFNFVVRDERKWTCLDSKADLDPDRCPTLFAFNEDVWVGLTYLRLARRSLRATV